MCCSCCNFISRVFAVILLFVPSLGLFNTLHHGRMATIPARNTINGEAFDHSIDGKLITFQDSWDKLTNDDPSDFVDFPPFAIFATVLVMFLFHIFASSCTLKVKLKSTSPFSFVPDGFYTLISPPLHYDWEFFYRQGNEQDTILLCWKRHV